MPWVEILTKTVTYKLNCLNRDAFIIFPRDRNFAVFYDSEELSHEIKRVRSLPTVTNPSYGLVVEGRVRIVTVGFQLIVTFLEEMSAYALYFLFGQKSSA